MGNETTRLHTVCEKPPFNIKPGFKAKGGGGHAVLTAPTEGRGGFADSGDADSEPGAAGAENDLHAGKG